MPSGERAFGASSTATGTGVKDPGGKELGPIDPGLCVHFNHMCYSKPMLLYWSYYRKTNAESYLRFPGLGGRDALR